MYVCVRVRVCVLCLCVHRERERERERERDVLTPIDDKRRDHLASPNANHVPLSPMKWTPKICGIGPV